MHETSFFAEPKNWVALAFIVFFVLFGRMLGALSRRCWTIARRRSGPNWMRRPGCAARPRLC